MNSQRLPVAMLLAMLPIQGVAAPDGDQARPGAAARAAGTTRPAGGVLRYLFPCQLPVRGGVINIPFPRDTPHFLTADLEQVIMLEFDPEHTHAAWYLTALANYEAATGADKLEMLLRLGEAHQQLFRACRQRAFRNTAVRYPQGGFLLRLKYGSYTAWRFVTRYDDGDQTIGDLCLYTMPRGEQELDFTAASREAVIKGKCIIRVQHVMPTRETRTPVTQPSGGGRAAVQREDTDIGFVREDVRERIRAQLSKEPGDRNDRRHYEWLTQSVREFQGCFAQVWMAPGCSWPDLKELMELYELFIERMLDSPGWNNEALSGWLDVSGCILTCRQTGPQSLYLVEQMARKLEGRKPQEGHWHAGLAHYCMAHLSFEKGDFAAALNHLARDVELRKSAKPDFDDRAARAWWPGLQELQRLKTAIENAP